VGDDLNNNSDPTGKYYDSGGTIGIGIGGILLSGLFGAVADILLDPAEIAPDPEIPNSLGSSPKCRNNGPDCSKATPFQLGRAVIASPHQFKTGMGGCSVGPVRYLRL
jgi:hypothetical protein